MCVADAIGHLAGGEEVHALVSEYADGGIHQRGVDERAFAGAFALGERGEDADHRIDAGEDVGHRHAGAGGFAVGGTGQAHEAADALRHEIVAGACGIRAVLAEACHRAVDQPRAVGREALIVEPEFREPADFEILDQHVGARRELLDDAPAVLALEIAFDRAFPAIGGVEIGSAEMAAVFALDERWPPGAGVVAGLASAPP